MHLELARTLEGQGRAGLRGRRRPSGWAAIASHYVRRRRPARSPRATIRAAAGRRRVHAYAEMVDLYERAHELWARVPDAATVAGIDEVALLEAAATACALSGDQRHSEMLAQRGLDLLDPTATPCDMRGCWSGAAAHAGA